MNFTVIDREHHVAVLLATPGTSDPCRTRSAATSAPWPAGTGSPASRAAKATSAAISPPAESPANTIRSGANPCAMRSGSRPSRRRRLFDARLRRQPVADIEHFGAGLLRQLADEAAMRVASEGHQRRAVVVDDQRRGVVRLGGDDPSAGQCGRSTRGDVGAGQRPDEPHRTVDAVESHSLQDVGADAIDDQSRAGSARPARGGRRSRSAAEIRAGLPGSGAEFCGLGRARSRKNSRY